MLWTLWDLFTVWNFLSMGWMLVYAMLFLMALALVIVKHAMTTPMRATAKARQEREYRTKNRAWVLDVERRWRP